MIDTELKIVIGHKPPVFDTPTDWKILTTDPNNTEDFFVDNYIILNCAEDMHVLGEYGYIIALAKKLKTMPEIRTLRLAQYRKIVSNTLLQSSRLSDDINNSYLIDIEKFSMYHQSLSEITRPNGSGFLIPNLIKIYTTLYQYARSHYMEDILLFTADAIECHVLSREQAAEFLHTNTLVVTGMSLGVYPCDFIIECFEKIEKIVLHHYNNKWIRREHSYQYRNLAFCIERLLSYFLLQKLQKLNINADNVSGSLYTITDDQNYVAGTKTV